MGYGSGSGTRSPSTTPAPYAHLISDRSVLQGPSKRLLIVGAVAFVAADKRSMSASVTGA